MRNPFRFWEGFGSVEANHLQVCAPPWVTDRFGEAVPLRMWHLERHVWADNDHVVAKGGLPPLAWVGGTISSSHGLRHADRNLKILANDAGRGGMMTLLQGPPCGAGAEIESGREESHSTSPHRWREHAALQSSPVLATA